MTDMTPEKYTTPIEKPKEDPFRPQHQRAYINGCCVDIFRYYDGAYTFTVQKPPSGIAWGKVIGQGAADSEEACKMLATRTAMEAE